MTSRPPSGARLHAAYWIAWYLPLVVLWLAFVDTVATAEVVLGLVAAAVAATAAELVRDQDLVRFRLRVSWLRDLYRLLGQVLGDCRVLAVALWRQLTGRPVHGVFRALPFPAERDDARSRSRLCTGWGTCSVSGPRFVQSGRHCPCPS